MTTPRLELRGVGKRYPGVVANDDISLSVQPGEIHAILGENGAGKSTLMKMIYGAERPDSGRIYYDGRDITSHNPAQSRALGIEMVYQHFVLFESMSAVENISLVVRGTTDLQRLADRVRSVSESYGIPIDPLRMVYDLSTGERQRIEIVRCLLQNPKLLILDEPTSVITPQAVKQLFGILNKLKADGCSIIYISHKLGEVHELCDSATVLRGGRVTGSVKPKETGEQELARLMVGKSVPTAKQSATTLSEKPVLQVKSLSRVPSDRYGTALKEVSFEVYGGEVVGIAGVSGNGQAELVRLLSGEELHQPATAVTINGKACGVLDAGQRRRVAHMAFVPEERLGRGAVPSHELWRNGLLTGHLPKQLVSHGLVSRTRAVRFARAVIEKFDVKARGAASTAQSLSGGNLQKFIVGREIELHPEFLLVAQPTWGVDVGAAAFIRQNLVDMSRAGAAVLIVSEELDEIFEICDRILVMSEGRISRSLNKDETDREEVGLLMTRGIAADPVGEARAA
ncbi:MAG TPA: ABC transporter ATP-binding protein [Nevskiaceae bacterium]|nr:ABC transporter ATP-binding protein [Nevskiaceae bacterium]